MKLLLISIGVLLLVAIVIVALILAAVTMPVWIIPFTIMELKKVKKPVKKEGGIGNIINLITDEIKKQPK